MLPSPMTRLLGASTLALLGAGAPLLYAHPLQAPMGKAPAAAEPGAQAPASLQPPGPEQAAKLNGWLSAWGDFIRPSAEELTFESIGWRNQFWPAVQIAQELERPILLWTMNGHPLGCT